MEERTVISASEFCHQHQIEISFIHSLHEYGLVEIEESGDGDCLLPQDQLEQVEKMVRLHYDLNINFEGLDAIYQLLQRVEHLQKEVILLRHKLRLYESG